MVNKFTLFLVLVAVCFALASARGGKHGKRSDRRQEVKGSDRRQEGKGSDRRQEGKGSDRRQDGDDQHDRRKGEKKNDKYLEAKDNMRDGGRDKSRRGGRGRGRGRHDKGDKREEPPHVCYLVIEDQDPLDFDCPPDTECTEDIVQIDPKVGIKRCRRVKPTLCSIKVKSTEIFKNNCPESTVCHSRLTQPEMSLSFCKPEREMLDDLPKSPDNGPPMPQDMGGRGTDLPSKNNVGYEILHTDVNTLPTKISA